MSVKKRIYIKLFYGEKDGWGVEFPAKDGKHPELFFVHRNIDDKRVSDARHAGGELANIVTATLAVLAYRYHSSSPVEGVPGGIQYRYDRCEASDRKLTDPAV